MWTIAGKTPLWEETTDSVHHIGSPCFRTLFFSFLSKTIGLTGSRVSTSNGFGPVVLKTYFRRNMTKARQIKATAIHIIKTGSSAAALLNVCGGRCKVCCWVPLGSVARLGGKYGQILQHCCWVYVIARIHGSVERPCWEVTSANQLAWAIEEPMTVDVTAARVLGKR